MRFARLSVIATAVLLMSGILVADALGRRLVLSPPLSWLASMLSCPVLSNSVLPSVVLSAQLLCTFVLSTELLRASRRPDDGATPS